MRVLKCDHYQSLNLLESVYLRSTSNVGMMLITVTLPLRRLKWDYCEISLGYIVSSRLTWTVCAISINFMDPSVSLEISERSIVLYTEF